MLKEMSVPNRGHLVGLGASLAAILLAGCASVEGPASPVSTGSGIEEGIEPIVPQGPVYVRSDFAGVLGSSVDARLGAPALVRREGEGEFRRYNLQNCNLIVILYPDELGRARVTQLETATKSSADAPLTLEECLAAG